MNDNLKIDFMFLTRNFNKSLLPSEQWAFTSKDGSFIRLQKLEEDLKVRKRVAILPNMSVKVYLDNEIVPFTEFITIVSIEQCEALLKKFDEIPLPSAT